MITLDLLKTQADLDADAAIALFTTIIAQETEEEKKFCHRIFLRSYATGYLEAKSEYTRRSLNQSSLEYQTQNSRYLFAYVVSPVQNAKGQPPRIIAQNLGRALGYFLGFFEYALITWCSGFSSEKRPIYHADESPNIEETVFPGVLRRSREFAQAMKDIGKPVSINLIAKRLQRIITRNQGKLSEKSKEALLCVAQCFV